MRASIFSGSTNLHRYMHHSVDLFDSMEALFASRNFATSITQNFPPHNIRKTASSRGDYYLIEMAVAGYTEADLDIQLEQNCLTISGRKEDNANDSFVYRGIAGRSFTKEFAIGDQVEMLGAELRAGMLYIALERIIPEEEKPQRIPIGVNSEISETITKLIA